MFERYTEDARKAIFFARFEAGQVGSAEIETEHLLLGLLRLDTEWAARVLQSPQKIETIRQRLALHRPAKTAIKTSVDLPVSHECRRVLTYANEASATFKQQTIGPEHLLLGIVREEKCFAATVLRENGITKVQLNEQLMRPAPAPKPGPADARSTASPLDLRDLTEAARSGSLGPLIGRERELDRMVHILCRRARNNVALFGEPGVGRTTLVEGLVQRIAAESVPPALAGKAVLSIHCTTLIDPRRPARTADRLDELLNAGRSPILCVEGMLDLAATPSGWGAMEAAHALEAYLLRGDIRCIATGSPRGFRQTMDTGPLLSRHFEAVELLPPDDVEATRILLGIKSRYEKFHNVIITDAAVETAVRASALFLPQRFLPERAIDLIDDAGARAKVMRAADPPEIAELRKKLRTHERNLGDAIARHEFEEARRHDEGAREDRLRLEELERQHAESASGHSVTSDDIEETVAARAGIPVATVRALIEQKHSGRLSTVVQALAAEIPIEGHEWLPFLAAYLVHCTPEQAARIAEIIRSTA